MFSLIKHLFKSESVAIFMHLNPDWDAFGSAMAPRCALRERGIKCDIFALAPLSFHLNFLETDVIVYEENMTAPDYECYCAVDVGSVSRLGEWGEFFKLHKNTVCIDHHPPEGGFAKMSVIDPGRCATGELIFELLTLYGAEITQKIACYLYCAISSDSGSFRYSSVTERTLEIVIELLKTGIDAAFLAAQLYDRHTLNQLKLEAEAISSIKIYGSGKIATAMISNETLQKYAAKRNDAEFLSQLPRTVAGVEISAFLSQTESGVRVNLRSQGTADVSDVARIFGGGGHKKAAGCTIGGCTLEEAEEKIVSELLKLV